MTKIHRLRFNEQKEGKRDKNGINTSKKLNLHLVHCYLLSVSVSNWKGHQTFSTVFNLHAV